MGVSGTHCPTGLVKGPKRCNSGILGCYRGLDGVAGSHWGVTGAQEVLQLRSQVRAENGGVQVGRVATICCPGGGVATGASQFRWETTGLPPTEDRRNSLLPTSKTQTSTSINFLIVTSNF